MRVSQRFLLVLALLVMGATVPAAASDEPPLVCDGGFEAVPEDCWEPLPGEPLPVVTSEQWRSGTKAAQFCDGENYGCQEAFTQRFVVPYEVTSATLSFYVKGVRGEGNLTETCDGSAWPGESAGVVVEDRARFGGDGGTHQYLTRGASICPDEATGSWIEKSVDLTEMFQDGPGQVLHLQARGKSDSGEMTWFVDDVSLTVVVDPDAKGGPLHILQAVREGAGLGLISSDDHGIDCHSDFWDLSNFADCDHGYEQGTVVQLTANASGYPDSRFLRWAQGSSCGGSRNPVCSVTMDEAKTEAAIFVKEQTRAVSLSLPFHLKARGTIDAKESSCAGNQTVRIQRQKASLKWETVKTTTTDSAGTYKTSIPDRPGKYRALAPPSFVGTESFCLKDVSPAKTHSH